MLALRREMLPPNSSIAEQLDVQLNQACLAVSVVLSLPYKKVQGIPEPDYLNFFDMTFLNLVFYSDARAQAGDVDMQIPPKRIWTPAAKTGFERLGKHVRTARGLAKITALSDRKADLQEQAYDDMVIKRGHVKGESILDGPEYAQQVARREVLLPQYRTAAAKYSRSNNKSGHLPLGSYVDLRLIQLEGSKL